MQVNSLSLGRGWILILQELVRRHMENIISMLKTELEDKRHYQKTLKNIKTPRKTNSAKPLTRQHFQVERKAYRSHYLQELKVRKLSSDLLLRHQPKWKHQITTLILKGRLFSSHRQQWLPIHCLSKDIRNSRHHLKLFKEVHFNHQGKFQRQHQLLEQIFLYPFIYKEQMSYNKVGTLREIWTWNHYNWENYQRTLLGLIKDHRHWNNKWR